VARQREANAKVFIQMTPQALRTFVKSLVIVEFPFDRRLKLLPDTGSVAEFRFRGQCALDGGASLPRAAISGLWTPFGHALTLAEAESYWSCLRKSGQPPSCAILSVLLFNTTTSMENVFSGSRS
jgi:hypothetical protein